MADLNIAVRIAGEDAGAGNLIDRITAGLGGLGGLAVAGVAVAGAAIVGLGAVAYKLGEAFDGAYDTIRVGTGATGEALEALKNDFRAVAQDVPAGFDKISEVVTDLNKRTGATGETLQGLSTRVLAFSRVTGTEAKEQVALATRTFGDWSIATEHQGDALDKLFRASQATGAGVGALQQKVVQFGAPLRAMGFTFEESISLLGKWEKEGVNAELVLGSMRIAMGNFAEQGIPMRKGLDDTIERIQKLGPGAAATSLAMKTFGARAGPDMAAAILEGRFALGDLLAIVEGGSDTILSAAADTEDFAEKWTRFLNRASIAVEPLATAVFGLAGSLLDDLTPAFESALAFLAENLPSAVAGAAAMFDSLRSGVGTVAGLVEPLLPTLRTLGDYFLFVVEEGDAFNDYLVALPGPLQLVTEVVGVFLSNGRELLDLFGRLATAAQRALGGDFAGALEDAGAALKNFADTVGANLRELAEDVFSAIQSALPGIVAQLRTWGEALIAWLPPQIPILLANLQVLGAEVLTWISAQAQPVLAQFAAWARSFVEWVDPAARDFLARWPGILNGFLNWIEGAAQPVLAQLGDWADSFVAWVIPAVTNFLAVWPGQLNRFLDWIESAVPPLVAQLAEWALAFVEWVVPLIPPLLIALAGVAGALVIFLASTLDVIIPRLSKWAMAFVMWVADIAYPGLLRALAGLGEMIGEWIKGQAAELLERAKAIGEALISGIRTAISSGVASVAAAAAAMVTDAINAAKAAAGIASPSRVTEEMGRDIVRGLVIGLSDNSAAARSASQMMTDIIREIRSEGDVLAGELRAWAQRAFEDLAPHSPERATRLRQELGALSTTFLGELRQLGEDAGRALDEISQEMNDKLTSAAQEASKQIGDAIRSAASAVDSAIGSINESRELRAKREEFAEGQELDALERRRSREDAAAAEQLARDLAKAKTEQDREGLQARFDAAGEDRVRRRRAEDEDRAFADRQRVDRQAFDDAIENDALARTIQRINDERDARILGIREALAEKQAAIIADAQEERKQILDNLQQRIEDLKKEYLDKVRALVLEVSGDMGEFADKIAKQFDEMVSSALGDIAELVRAIGAIPPITVTQPSMPSPWIDAPTNRPGWGAGPSIPYPTWYDPRLPSRDDGGPGYADHAYAIGRAAQPEVFVPDQDGTFYPRGEGLGGQPIDYERLGAAVAKAIGRPKVLQLTYHDNSGKGETNVRRMFGRMERLGA